MSRACKIEWQLVDLAKKIVYLEFSACQCMTWLHELNSRARSQRLFETQEVLSCTVEMWCDRLAVMWYLFSSCSSKALHVPAAVQCAFKRSRRLWVKTVSSRPPHHPSHHHHIIFLYNNNNNNTCSAIIIIIEILLYYFIVNFNYGTLNNNHPLRW